jgi:hypothetical protein
MNDLPDTWQKLLHTIVEGPLAWQTPVQLSARLGLDLDATYDILAGLDLGGWLEPWEMGATLYITLSPLAAERARVRLTPVGFQSGAISDSAMRWISIDEPVSSPRAKGCSDEDRVYLDGFVDPAPGPDVELEAAERDARIAERKLDAGDARWHHFLPRPTILLGVGLSPWPGPRQHKGPHCPACGSKPISESAYCLICDRWGLDHVFADHLKTGRARHPGGKTKPISSMLTEVKTIPLSSPPARGKSGPISSTPTLALSEAARAARKEKRRRKRAKQAEKARIERAGR